MTQRLQWEDLKEDVRDAIQARTGPVMRAEVVSEGINSDITLIIETAGAGRLFVKGTRATDARRVRSLNREASINPYVTAISPELRWQIREADWVLLVFDFIDSRRIDYSPASPDLPLILETLTVLSEIECPDLQLPFLEQRLSNYARPTDLQRFIGNALLHTDLNPGNVRIANGRAYLVDWACPTRGVAWSGAADLALCLITCGHAPRDAEQIVSRIPAWKSAEEEAIDALVRTTEATWTDLSGKPGDDIWTNSTVAAARRWSVHRMGL